MHNHLPLATMTPPDDEQIDLTSEMLCESAARWRTTLRETETAKLIWVGAFSVMLLAFMSEIVWLLTSSMWLLVMWNAGCRQNFCAKVGGAAMLLAIGGSVAPHRIRAGPAQLLSSKPKWISGLRLGLKPFISLSGTWSNFNALLKSN